MAYSQITPILGQVQQGYSWIVDSIQREILGTVIPAVDNYYGFGEFMYVQFPASSAIPSGTVVVISGFGGPLGHVASIAPNTANTGRSIGVAINAVPSLGSVQYGWVQISGNAVIRATASVAAGTTFGIDVTVAGSVAANTAGRQVLNAVSVAASTFTVVKTAQTLNGSPFIKFTDVSGFVLGVTLTGTGVSGTVLVIDYDNRTITSTANSTATGSTAVTGTYTGFIVGQINRSILQGAIT